MGFWEREGVNHISHQCELCGPLCFECHIEISALPETSYPQTPKRHNLARQDEVSGLHARSYLWAISRLRQGQSPRV